MSQELGIRAHLGNAVAPDADHPFDLQQENKQNLASLAAKFDTTKYLSSTSDIVALMTLEHQARMTNLIAALNQQFRRAATVHGRVRRRISTAL